MRPRDGGTAEVDRFHLDRDGQDVASRRELPDDKYRHAYQANVVVTTSEGVRSVSAADAREWLRQWTAGIVFIQTWNSNWENLRK